MYLPIGILAYVLSGFSLAIDKGLVRNSIRNPLVMTFYIGVFNLVLLLAIPIGFRVPPVEFGLVAALAGIMFGLAVLAYLTSLKFFDLLVAAPLVGMINPLVSSGVDKYILRHQLGGGEILDILLLVVGGGILTSNLWFGRHALSKKLLWVGLAGILFGLSYSLLGEAFSLVGFLDTLVISRLAFAVMVLGFLLSGRFRRSLWESKVSKNHFENRTSLMLVIGQLMSAGSGLLIFIGVYLATPALINSLFSTQYVVLLMITLILSRHNPKYLHENLSRGVIIQKVTGLIFISAGMVRLLLGK